MTELAVEPGEPGEFGRLIDSAGAGGAVVDLLEADDVGFGAANHGCDPGQIDPAVGAAAMVDVVGEHAERRLGGGSRPAQDSHQHRDGNGTALQENHKAFVQ